MARGRSEAMTAEQEELDELTEAELEEEAEGTTEGKGLHKGRKFTDLPEGYHTLAGFAKHLKDARGVTVRPQQIFGYSKNSKTFPNEVHTDGRNIVNTKAGLDWWDAKEQRKAEKAAASTESSSE